MSCEYHVDTPIEEGAPTHRPAPPFRAYMDMRRDLLAIRERNEGKESEVEDQLLDAMDVVWKQLTKEERDQINAM